MCFPFLIRIDWFRGPFGAFGQHERLKLRFHDVMNNETGTVAPGRLEFLLALGRDLTPEERLLVHNPRRDVTVLCVSAISA